MKNKSFIILSLFSVLPKTNCILMKNSPNSPITELVSHRVSWESFWYIFGSAFRSISRIRCSGSLYLSMLHVASLGYLPLCSFQSHMGEGLCLPTPGTRHPSPELSFLSMGFSLQTALIGPSLEAKCKNSKELSTWKRAFSMKCLPPNTGW